MRAALAALALAALAATGAGAAEAPGRQRTLTISSTPIEHLLQDGRWLAWRHYCDGQRLTVKAAGRAARTYNFCGIHPTGSNHLALAGGRLLWNVSASGNFYYDEVLTVGPGGRRSRLLAELVSDNGDSTGTHLGDMAGDGTTLVFSTVVMRVVPGTCDENEYHCEVGVGGGRIWRVRGLRRSAVPGAPPAWLLAASGGTIALAPAHESERRQTIELRHVGSGRRLARMQTSRPIVDLALSPRYVAALIDVQDRRGQIEVFSTWTGELVRALPVSPSTRTVSISGGRIVYRAGRAVRLIDVVDGRNVLLAVTRMPASAPSIEANRVAWGVRLGRRWVVRAVNL